MSKVICIIGPGRTGSSLLARILNLAGMSLGHDLELAVPRSFNQAGTWENRGFAAINTRVLRMLGCNGNIPPALTASPAWAEDPRFMELKNEANEAQRLIEAEFSGVDFWGWKDPMTTLALPFWQTFLPEMSYIIALRNPVDMVASFRAESGYSRKRCFAICFLFTVAALWHTAGKPRLIVFYEDLVERFHNECARILRFVKVPELLNESRFEEMKIGLRLNLRHYNSAIQALEDPECPRSLRTLYYSLYAFVRAGGYMTDGIEFTPIAFQQLLAELARSGYEEFCGGSPIVSRMWNLLIRNLSLRARRGAVFYQINRLMQVLAQEGSRELWKRIFFRAIKS